MSMRQAGSAMRSTSAFQPASASGQSPLLLARISEKKAELESLKELRDLSAQMAGQMEMLEEKLGTLANGTEAIAAILSNWHNVLRAIRMASTSISKPATATGGSTNGDMPLPQTLIRIPVQQRKTPST